ncbi:RNA-guided endonuclease InsQ/TnpB family protein [Catellatospora bangladeshensis]|uniref:RNA-guided endonuclease InsQ/TnpB family protein n=1 Tax=Catellatospora bangladeshensis TaxID=310355 RepID=UPI00360E34B0
MSATVRHTGGRWHVSFTVQVTRTIRTPAYPPRTVGVDVGISNLAVLSTGQVVPNPRHLAAAAGRLRAAARTMSRRQGPDRRTGRQPSRRWQQAKARLARAHARVAYLRADGLHKLTTTLAGTYGTIVVEDLNVAGMIRNRRLARHIADAGWATLRRHLEYKTTWNGGRLITADRWFASSKTCSSCGAVKPKLRLRERTYTCEHCGLRLDRDLNAAINLQQYVARSGWETLNGRGADLKSTLVVAGGCETTTPHHPPGGSDGDRRPTATRVLTRAHSTATA